MNLRCPHCGEPTDTFVDEGGGGTQDYIEDCCVCCRPIRFRVTVDPETGECSVIASPDP